MGPLVLTLVRGESSRTSSGRALDRTTLETTGAAAVPPPRPRCAFRPACAGWRRQGVHRTPCTLPLSEEETMRRKALERLTMVHLQQGNIELVINRERGCLQHHQDKQVIVRRASLSSCFDCVTVSFSTRYCLRTRGREREPQKMKLFGVGLLIQFSSWQKHWPSNVRCNRALMHKEAGNVLWS